MLTFSHKDTERKMQKLGCTDEDLALAEFDKDIVLYMETLYDRQEISWIEKIAEEISKEKRFGS